jgi:hypothetical protein
MSSGPKKDTKIYILSFSLKKSRQANSFQVPQWSFFGERYLLTGHFYISLDISLILKALRKEHNSIFPKSGPLWKQTPIPETLNHFRGSGGCLKFEGSLFVSSRIMTNFDSVFFHSVSENLEGHRSFIHWSDRY